MLCNPQSFTKVHSTNKRQWPTARSGHACVADESHLYLYGGFNNRLGLGNTLSAVLPELWVFNFVTGQWTNVWTPGIPEQAASASVKLWNKKLFVYGGTGYPFGNEMNNIVHVCHIDQDFKWDTVPTSNENFSSFPLKAYGQGIVNHGGDIFVFGGAVGLYLDPVNQLHRLKFSRCDKPEWERIKTTGDLPSGRYKSDVIIHPSKEKFLVLGGGNLYGSQSLTKLHSYNFESQNWRIEETFADGQSLDYPKGRAAFGCVQKDNLVFISGGRHYDVNESEALDDVWSLDLISMRWSHMHLRLPKPLYFHSMALSPNGDVYVFGGVNKDVRMGDLFQASLFLPNLAELCWKVYIRSLNDINKSHASDLVKMGVPQQFVNRLPNFGFTDKNRSLFKCDPS